MEPKIIPWPGEQLPTETAIRNLLHTEGLEPYRWSNAPGDVYGAHSHAYHKVLYVVEGAITFGLPDLGQHLALPRHDLPGDHLGDLFEGKLVPPLESGARTHVGGL